MPRFVFEIDPTVLMAREAWIAILFAIVFYIGAPVALGIVEYRLTQKNKKHGMFLLLGTFASVLLLGLFSAFVGIILLAIFLVTTKRSKTSRMPAKPE